MIKNNQSLLSWLSNIQSLHVKNMDLSLERVYQVAKLLNIEPNCPVITVAGTNGKGSCVAGLEAIYLAAGYRVGAFTSPILFRHNEYVRLNGHDAEDLAFCDAYACIDAIRGEITLTPFEFTALAAFLIFQEADLDLWILEVGLGGRFDAVNIIDTNVAIISSIGIDHVDWLGDTREKIAYEKAGIFRQYIPAICGDLDPPEVLMDYANKIGAIFYAQNKDFYYVEQSDSWCWISHKNHWNDLPKPQLALQNMATVLMAIESLQSVLPAPLDAIRAGLKGLALPGRIQVLSGAVTRIFDVSHNPAAAGFLGDFLRKNSYQKVRAVFSMLADKDILATLLVMKEWVDHWYIASLNVKRAASLEMLHACFSQAEIHLMQSYDNIKQAYQYALSDAESGECVVIFGSFHTVSECYVENLP